MSQYLGDISAYALAVSQGYTGTEEEYAELMASYATVGQTAVTAAQTATTKASEAATSATTATNKASEATTAATTATTKADEASTSASTATSAKDTAVSASQTATTKATEATTAAATATSAATTATTAKDDAVSAKTAAQTAQTGAETAAASVQESASQIAQNTSDISELKEDLTHKANQDGYYADLVSGGSTQLLSNLEQTDMVPYNYRTAGGSLEIGDREKLKKIVGGSLAVNQLVTDPNFTDGTKWDSIARAYATVSVSNNEITMTVVETVSANGIMNINSTVPNRAGHKLLFSAYVNPSKSVNVRIGSSGSPAAGDYGLDSSPVAASTWTLMEKIGSCQSGNTASSLNLYLDVGSALTEGDTVKVKNFVCFDLTQMFGTTIADYVYGLETATAGAGVAWLKSHFPRIFDSGYIPYNAGTLEHVSGLSAHKMVGFNQWDEEWELGQYNTSTGAKSGNSGQIRCKNYIQILPSTTYYVNSSSNTNAYFKPLFYDANKNYIGTVDSFRNNTFTTPSNAHYMTFYMNSSYGTTYLNNICINLHWDGERDGEYEPYEEHSYPLDSDVTLRGIPKLDANNNLYYDGDEYEADGTVTRKYGIVDLGTLTWQLKANATNTFYSWNLRDLIKPNESVLTIANIVCNKYITGAHQYVYNIQTLDKAISVGSLGELGLNDTAYTTREAISAALSGVYLVYELATPTTESADPYTEIQNVSNWGTEEFVTTSLVPVGHETAYQPDLRAKIEVAPESPDTDGMYLMKRENGQNSYVAYLGELPSDPTTDGTYTLKCTVASGTATKTWEADT